MRINITTPDKYKKLETLIKNKEPVLVLYRAEWCGHCQEFKPMWNNFTKIAKIKTAEIETNDFYLLGSTPEHQVNSYPTLKLFTNGKVINFDEDRNIDNMNKFIKMHVKVIKPKVTVKPKPKAKAKSKPKK
jgi:thiol-disulfide isomerase/thioredoxin